MSAFPRRVPRAVRKYNKNHQRIFVGGLSVTPLVVGIFGEYRGWWDKFTPPKPGSPEALLLETQQDDIRALREHGFGFDQLNQVFTRTAESRKEVMNRATKGEMAVGVKTMIKNELNEGEEESVKVHRDAFSKPTQSLQGEQLITFTSSKKPDPASKPDLLTADSQDGRISGKISEDTKS